jgi:hypothetical protein
MNTPDEKNNLAVSRRGHWARRTHRVIGVSALFFLLILALSGLILNHADGLGLSRYAAGPLVLRLYGVELPPVDSAFEAGDILFATSSGTLYADGVELAGATGNLVGAVAVEDGLIAATGGEFFVLTSDAALIERFAPQTAGALTGIGSDGKRVLTMLQNELFELDTLSMSLSSADSIRPDTVTWSQAATPGAEQVEQIGRTALGQALNWERVLLDVHSGRILPTLGRFIADLAALCLIYLCISGAVLWTRRR